MPAKRVQLKRKRARPITITWLAGNASRDDNNVRALQCIVQLSSALVARDLREDINVWRGEIQLNGCPK
jgi:hypothetical protein